jgi:gluconolactonase
VKSLILLCLVSLLLLAACQTKKVEHTSTPAEPSIGSIERIDPALDAIVPVSARIEKIGSGFEFTEGPIYMREGYLLFSDVQGNVIRKWTPEGGAVDFRRPSGYDGTDAPKGAFIGSNGLTCDQEGRLVICEHGNRRVTRLEKDGKLTVLAAKYQGKRLNSPNDAVYKSDGSLYFTDPPYGFPKEDQDPRKELKFNGIYRLSPDGKLILLSREMTRPNGLGFSPDEKYFYVANSDAARKVWMKFEVKTDGTLGEGKVFADVTSDKEAGEPDGMKLDVNGNLYCTGPGGIWIFSPEGKHLGTIKPPETPANLHWGKFAKTNAEAGMKPDEQATTLYITARTGLYRIQLSVAGIRP